MAKFQKKAAPGEPDADGTTEVEKTEEIENPTPEAIAEPAVAEEVQPAPTVAEPETPATDESDEDEEEDERPRPKLCAMLRSAIDAHRKFGGDAFLTGEFEALILKLHEVRNGINAVQDKTEGELSAWLSHINDLI